MSDHPTEPLDRDLASDLRSCVESHGRLVASLEAIDDVVVARPSVLPGWTIGHVLSHISRNADSFVRMMEAAADGRAVSQYPGGSAQRTGEIESGSKRAAAAIVNDVRTSAARLDQAFAGAPDEVWRSSGTVMSGDDMSMRALPFRRVREVEFHHLDLGLGYSFTDCPASVVADLLTESLVGLPRRITEPDQRGRFLAWVAGRTESPGAIDLAPF